MPLWFHFAFIVCCTKAKSFPRSSRTKRNFCLFLTKNAFQFVNCIFEWKRAADYGWVYEAFLMNNFLYREQLFLFLVFVCDFARRGWFNEWNDWFKRFCEIFCTFDKLGNLQKTSNLLNFIQFHSISFNCRNKGRLGQINLILNT